MEGERERMQRLREDENAEHRENRLEGERERMQRLREDENAEHRENRLEGERERMHALRQDENAEHRHNRIESDRVRHRESRLNPMVTESRNVEARSGIIPDTCTLNLRNRECEFGCSALRFEGSELKSGNCCNKGATSLDLDQGLISYPEDLRSLLLGNHPNSRTFFDYIRRYNSAVAFASMGSKNVTPAGNGPYCYRIHGQIYHRLGVLQPDNNVVPQYGQIYILEGDGALDARISNNTDCLRNVIFLIQQTLEDCCNPYITAYRNLHAVEQEEICIAEREGRLPHAVRMVFHSGPDSRRYNAPVQSDDVAAIFVGNDSVPGKQELCVYPKNVDALCKIPGRLYRIYSRDYFSNAIDNMTTSEMLSLNPKGFPVHELQLKETCTVRLLKRLSNYPDMQIGDRLKVTIVNNFNIMCEFNGNIVNIGRENFVSQHFGNEFIRNQFPLQLDIHLDVLCPRNKNVDPMVYPLSFPSGEKEWHENMIKQGRPNARYARISQLQFYSYRLAYRENPFSPLHYGRKLFQQYIVDSWVRIESNRLNFHRLNQAQLRAHRYMGLMDHFENEEIGSDTRPPGKPIILP